MDFLSKFLQRKPPKSGGGSPAASSTPTVPIKPDHEAHVQFAREFVVELVETVPKKSEKAALAKVADKEDIVSLKSVSPSEGSFQSVNTVSENTSLPDLLQPESVYKKQTDTDTDTTEYESAAETEPSDAASPVENLIAEDIITSFNETLDKKHLPTDPPKQSSDNSVSQTSEPSPLSEVYEDVDDSIVQSKDEDKSLDISGLCLFVSNLCLDSPKRSEDSESPEGQKDCLNNSRTVVNNTVVTEQSFAVVGDSTFVLEDSCAKENLGDSPSDCDQFKTTQIDSAISTANSATVIPENKIVLPEKSLESESVVSESSSVKDSESILEVTSEVTSAKSAQELPIESHSIKEAEASPVNTLQVTSTEASEDSPVETSEVPSKNILELTTTNFSEELPVKSAEIKQCETSHENNLELKSNQPEDLTGELSEVKQVELSSENIPEVTSKFTEILPVQSAEKSEDESLKILEDSQKTCQILPTSSVQRSSGESHEIAPGVSSLEPTKVSEKNIPESKEVKLNEISELVNSLIRQTELSSEENLELPIKPISAPIIAVEETLQNLEESPVKPTEAGLVISTKVLTENFEVSQIKLTEVTPETPELSSTFTDISPKTPTSESLTSTESPLLLPAKQIEQSLKAPEKLFVEPTGKTSEEGRELKHPEETFEQEQPVVSENTQLQRKSQETEVVTTRETADPIQEWTSETDICSSESIPVEETPSVASVTNSIESKDFSTSFEVLSTEKEANSELCEDKVQTETVDSAKYSIQTQSHIKVLNSSTEFASGINKLQHTEKEVEVEKEAPTVLTELFEICNRQQKDLELGDEKFVDGREFFDLPSISRKLNETVVVSDSQTGFSETVTVENYGDFDESITEEAEKISQEIINASSHLNDSSVKLSDSNTQQIPKMADVQGGSNSSSFVDDSKNPFVTQSSVRRSPPPSAKPSPRSSSQGPSPVDSPRTRSKLSSVNPARENSFHGDGTGDMSPRTRSGKNSPDCRITSNRVSNLEDSPKNSIISSEINQSEAGPEIADDGHVQGGDVFKDPSTFDFLNSVGNSNIVTDLRKESLYVKFDPLVGGARTTDQSVPLPSAYEAKSNNIGPTASSSPHESFSNNVTPPRNIAISVVDKLISLSPSPRRQQQQQQLVETPVKQIITPVSTPVKEESQNYPDHLSMVEELYLLREILAKQDEKHREDILMQQQKLEQVQVQLKEYEEREARLNKKVAEKSQGQKQMSLIMEEYEKTISRLVAEKEQERQAHELDRASLVKERDTAMGHLANIEIAFSDLHKKYERSKTVIEGFKKNEEVLRASLADYEATIRKQEQKYDVLKNHAMAQLENANQELDSVKRCQQAEAAKLKAMLKKAEVKTSSLEEMLEQKVKENQELASICDELISKVGSSE